MLLALEAGRSVKVKLFHYLKKKFKKEICQAFKWANFMCLSSSVTWVTKRLIQFYVQKLDIHDKSWAHSPGKIIIGCVLLWKIQKTDCVHHWNRGRIVIRVQRNICVVDSLRWYAGGSCRTCKTGHKEMITSETQVFYWCVISHCTVFPIKGHFE